MRQCHLCTIGANAPTHAHLTVRMFSSACSATPVIFCSARACRCSIVRVRRRYTAAATAAAQITIEQTGARRQERQKSTTTEPNISRSARRPRSRETLLRAGGVVCVCQRDGGNGAGVDK